MHKVHARDGLVVISVALEDDPKDAEARRRTEKFLQKVGATFTNVLLASEANKPKLNIVAPPLLFVFDRDNRIAARFDPAKSGADRIDEKAVDKVVLKLLGKGAR